MPPGPVCAKAQGHSQSPSTFSGVFHRYYNRCHFLSPYSAARLEALAAVCLLVALRQLHASACRWSRAGCAGSVGMLDDLLYIGECSSEGFDDLIGGGAGHAASGGKRDGARHVVRAVVQDATRAVGGGFEFLRSRCESVGLGCVLLWCHFQSPRFGSAIWSRKYHYITPLFSPSNQASFLHLESASVNPPGYRFSSFSKFNSATCLSEIPCDAASTATYHNTSPSSSAN